MPAARRESPGLRIDLRLWPVALVLLALAAGGDSRASAAPAHHCKCASKCKGASCCCGSHGEAPHPAEPKPVDRPALRESGPCLNPAPCGHPAAPTRAAPAPIGRSAALTTALRVGPDPVEDSLGSRGPEPAPARRSIRLERPPKRPVTA